MGNCVIHGNNRIPSAADDSAVTLVVGNDIEHKSRVAKAIADALGARYEEVSKAGVRIFTDESSPATPVVVDTLPLSVVRDCERVDNTRVWISQNSLRRLCGKRVFVVCVLASTDPNDEIYREPDFEGNRFGWLHLLAFIFEQHRQDIVLLVNSEDTTDESSTRIAGLRKILKRDGFQDTNTKFFNFEGRVFSPTIESIVQQIFYRGEANDETTVGNSSAKAHAFFLREVAPNVNDKDRFGPWGPENIIMFGRAGSGKSTLAQMLTLGRLDGRSRKFSFSSKIRGETRAVKNGQGRGWRVIDTPGLGESINDGQSAVHTAKARRLIKEYVLLRDGTYTHFIYVWRKSRLDDLDERLWEVFVQIFGAEMIKTHMTIVVSDADQDWLDENITHLKECFKDCESFTTANFPGPEEDDADAEEEIQEIRLESLKALEDHLASLGRVDACCQLGMWSIGTQLSMNIRGLDEFITLRPSLRQSYAFSSSVGHANGPSDYETARVHIRWKLWKSTFVPWKK